MGERGGVVVDDHLRTSAENVYAVGEIALHDNFIYGLVAPGYDMAKVAARHCAKELGLLDDVDEEMEDELLPSFTGANLSTKLKLLGCDVASFGVYQPKPDDEDVTNLVWDDPLTGVYRKLILNKAGNVLRGGILVGDAGDYSTLHKLAMSGAVLEVPAAELLPPPSARTAVTNGAETGAASEDPNAQICSCNDVSRGDIASVISEVRRTSFVRCFS